MVVGESSLSSVNSQAALRKRCSVQLPQDKAGLRPCACKQGMFSGFHTSQTMLLPSGLVSRVRGGNNPCYDAASPEMAPGDEFPRPRPTPGCYLRLLGAQASVTLPGMGSAGSDYCGALILVP